VTTWIVPLGGLTIAHGGAMATGGLLLLATAPIMVMEGEELPVIVIGCLLGVAWIAAGALQIVCGVGLTRHRMRVPALVAIVAGFVASAPLCGCVPTVALTAAGLVILTRPEVIAAFDGGDAA
jgi:hypothetical protein